MRALVAGRVLEFGDEERKDMNHEHETFKRFYYEYEMIAGSRRECRE